MRLISNDDINKICRNNYEAVQVAAQYARKLNAARISKENSNRNEEEEIEQPAVKVTSQALYDLVDDKINFSRPS